MDIGTILPIVAIVGIVALVIIYAWFLNSKLNEGSGSKTNWEERENRKMAVKNARIVSFIEPKHLSFYDCLKSALPKTYIVYPNVCLELLFHKAQRAELNLSRNYADFLVLTDRFVPTLVIDLLDYSHTGEAISNIKGSVGELIRNSGIPIMQYSIRDSYSVDDLRRTIARTMNPLYQDK